MDVLNETIEVSVHHGCLWAEVSRAGLSLLSPGQTSVTSPTILTPHSQLFILSYPASPTSSLRRNAMPKKARVLPHPSTLVEKQPDDDVLFRGESRSLFALARIWPSCTVARLIWTTFSHLADHSTTACSISACPKEPRQ